MSTSYCDDAWLRYEDIDELRAVRFVQGRATRVDNEGKMLHWEKTTPDGKGMSVEVMGYDYLVVATGLRRSFPTVPKSLTKEQYLTDARKHVASLEAAREAVVVVGGGR